MQWLKRTIIVQKLTLVVELWGLLSPRCPPSHERTDPTVIGSIAPRKGSRRFCPHRGDCCRALMLTCRNSPLWQRCERCNNVLSSFWPPWLNQLNSVVITWRALIGTSRKLAAYNCASSLALEQRLSTSWWRQNWSIQKVGVEPATRSAVATCK